MINSIFTVSIYERLLNEYRHVWLKFILFLKSKFNERFNINTYLFYQVFKNLNYMTNAYPKKLNGLCVGILSGDRVLFQGPADK